MEITDSSMDYGDKSLLIHFEGGFQSSKLIDFVDENYPSFPKWEISEVEAPSEFRGYTNPGRVLIQFN